MKLKYLYERAVGCATKRRKLMKSEGLVCFLAAAKAASFMAYSRRGGGRLFNSQTVFLKHHFLHTSVEVCESLSAARSEP